ncbi:MAG TPA: hypothetical protein PLQ23_13950, partial [Dermatophilaceae bacterium]|nr:hypothetical protein [Dermatophilaceae bacterium]
MSAISPPAPAGRSRSSDRRRRKGSGSLPALLLVPSLIILLGALAYPMVWQVITSFQKFGLAQQFGQVAGSGCVACARR